MFYSVVLLDGKELQNLSLEQVKDLFFRRQINQDSLICSSDNPRWQMLRRVFDLSQWIPVSLPPGAPPANFQTSNQTAPQPFNQTAPPPVFQPPANSLPQASAPVNQTYQPVTFNQFPPNQTNQSSHTHNARAANGYSQNNQTETYYQAETNQTSYNFQNNQAAFAPSKYNSPTNSFNYAGNAQTADGARPGTKPAAVFLVVNAIFYVVYLVFGNVFGGAEASGDGAYNTGRMTGSFVPLIVDLILAIKLWKLDDAESARKWVLGRTYFGFAAFGLIFPLYCFSRGDIFVGAFSFISTFFYFISLALVLHGKENPSPSRVMIGMGTFAIYFLVMFGTISLAFVGKIAPNMAKITVPGSRQLEKYKIEGKEFKDKTTGAKILLPDGWSMVSLDNPLIHTPEARMIAIDGSENRLTMLEVVPVPGNFDIKRQNSGVILDQLADNVVQGIKREVQKDAGSFGNRDYFNEITRLNIYIGTHPAKLLVFEKNEQGFKAKGHMIITYDELTFYVLHSWCPVEEYETAQADFTFFEKNFVVPEKINSPFTQTAETQKK